MGGFPRLRAMGLLVRFRLSTGTCLTTTRRTRRVPRRIEFFEGTLTNTDEIESVRIFDTTLRDGEQSPRTSFDYNDKRAIAELLDEMGTHVIEAGFPVNSEPEFEAVSDIAAATDATTCGLARVVEKDVEAAIDAGVDMVHVFVSTSDVQLQDSMHASREEAVDRAVASVEQVREAGLEVMFSPMDATRTNESFLVEVVEAVSEAGVDWINIPDTCGVGTPSRFAKLISLVDDHTDAQDRRPHPRRLRAGQRECNGGLRGRRASGTGLGQRHRRARG